MSSGVMVTIPSAALGFVVLLLLLLLLLLWALARASSAAPRSSFSNRPCVAAPRGGGGRMNVSCFCISKQGNGTKIYVLMAATAP